ncbi:MAG: hypothetical protein KJ067_07945 [Vicinamibacteria bacterium]|nr:hypothetical protein [Vicinamibacteria bacterium]
MSSRVVVSGIGLVTSLGCDVEAFWDALLAGRCGTGPVRSFDTSAYPVHVGGEVADFDPASVPTRLDRATLGRTTLFALSAARRARSSASTTASSRATWRGSDRSWPRPTPAPGYPRGSPRTWASRVPI